MPTRAEGTCPECGEKVGIKVSDSIAMLAGSQIERLMDKDGNCIRCSNCGEYHDPDDMSLVE